MAEKKENQAKNISTVRAKFSCDSITKRSYGTTEVKMTAVYSDEGENAAFAEATPSGSFELTIDPERPASDFFKAGREYYLDISEAPEKGDAF